jgi:LPXTG-motif cell wall-anchored protein
LTGTDILRWVIFASALIAAGTFLVLFNRRRARA